MTDRKSLSAYIAWLSTCLLAAAAGHLIDDHVRTTWLLLGAFGLVAAVGLQIASRTFQSRQNQKLQSANQLRLRRQLGHSDASDAANVEGLDSVAAGKPDFISGGIVAPPPRTLS
jgi:ABC-type transport system involved in cytochrome bd biosynthesis fused ATPase/permease subunit